MSSLLCNFVAYSIAFLSFGLSNPEALCITNGLAWVLVGGGELAVYLKFPEYFETGEK